MNRQGHRPLLQNVGERGDHARKHTAPISVAPPTPNNHDLIVAEIFFTA